MKGEWKYVYLIGLVVILGVVYLLLRAVAPKNSTTPSLFKGPEGTPFVKGPTEPPPAEQ